MVRLWSHVIVLLAIYVGLSSCYIKTYYGEDVCGETLVLGKNFFGFKVDFYKYGKIYHNYACLTYIQGMSPYATKLKVISSNNDCYDMFLRLEYRSIVKEYPLCNVPTRGIDIPSTYNVTLGVVFKGESSYRFLDVDYYLYSYLEDHYLQTCDSSSSRCLNGRCLHHDLFCYDSFNFCDDGTNRNCDNNITDDFSSSINYGRNVGIVALMIALCLVFVLIVYYCCCRLGRDRSSSTNTARRPTPTARDVYTIPTSEDNPDEIDYVIDYRKFEEPPPYDSLELTDLSIRPSTHAHTNEGSDFTQSGICGASAFHSSAPTFIMETEANIETNNLHTETETNHGGVSNEAFENELPSYQEVLSDERRFHI